jgi:nucleoside 2-deoxyribosyltransferase
MKLYFANDLFNDATLAYNEMVVREIEEVFPNLNVYLPQRNEAINDKTAYANSKMIADADLKELYDSDLLIAVLDSDDSGVALEVGAFEHTQRPIIGIYTDTRRVAFGNRQKKDALDDLGENQVSYTNLMVVGVIKNNGHLVDSHKEAIEILKQYLR